MGPELRALATTALVSGMVMSALPHTGDGVVWAQDGGTPMVSEHPEVIVDIDLNDEVIIREEPMTGQDIVDLVDDLHRHGCETLLVRMGFLGLLPYRTDLSYPLHFDEEDFRANYWGSADEIERLVTRNKSWLERYRALLADCNPPEVFVRAGHERGMKVIMWIDIYDDYYSGFHSKFLDENPHCQWTARDGETYFRGLIQYAWPEARRFRVQQAMELLDLGADGIHLSTSAHCRHMPNVQEDDFYGFGEPIVEECRALLGVDIRAAEEFDKYTWHLAKGRAVNRLYREVAEVCYESDAELWIGLQIGEYVHMAADPYFGDNVVARYRNLWRPLLAEGIADAIIVGDYESMKAGAAHAYWRAKPCVPDDADLYAFGAEQYGPLCRENGVKMYLFGEWLPGSPQALDTQLAAKANIVLTHGYDGIDLHESMSFERGKMHLLQRMADRLRGEEVEPLGE